MSLEQSMKSAIETLAQLGELKKEVVALTETRDTLRGVTEKADAAHVSWLKTVEKTNALQARVEAEIADKQLAAEESCEKMLSKAKSEAYDAAKKVAEAMDADLAGAKQELAKAKEALAASKAELNSLSASIRRGKDEKFEIDSLIAELRAKVLKL